CANSDHLTVEPKSDNCARAMCQQRRKEAGYNQEKLKQAQVLCRCAKMSAGRACILANDDGTYKYAVMLGNKSKTTRW
ncbi:hypothetical protein HK101_006558, partial [Irineochytrium annulatum]